MENLRNDLQNRYHHATQNYGPLFDFEAFKLCSESTFPCLIFWGTDYKSFYNEGFAQLMRIDETKFFGQEGSSIFCKEAWPTIKNLVDSVIDTKASLGVDSQLLYLDRKGFLEECYFDFNVEPITLGELVQGVYCTLIDSSKRVIDERRLNLLTQLANETHRSQSLAQACETITTILNRFRADVPFTLTYLLKSNDRRDQVYSSGEDNPLKEFFNVQEFCDEIKYVEGLKNPVSKAVLIPIKCVGKTHPFCMVIFGISPTLELNNDYKEFHILLARFLSNILSKIQMIESKQRDLSSRDEFISIASHEFKTPITALKLRLAITNKKINLENDKGPSLEEMVECIKTANQQADRLTSLVDELLDVTRIQRGKFQFHFEDMSLNELLFEIAKRSEDQLEKTGNSLEINLEEEFKVKWHRSRIDQVFSNLISNTLKYAPATKIVINAKKEFSILRITYCDNGPGIPKDKHDKIFERFEGGQTSTRVGGLGLGLYIVREIVRGHGGSIQIESDVGQGSKFILLLPIDP